MSAPIAFGEQFNDVMPLCHWDGNAFSEPTLVSTNSIEIHPGAHVLHYSSCVFEGLKAHRGQDGVVRIFRLDAHVRRMRRSAELLCLPVPSTELLTGMVTHAVQHYKDQIPEPPGSLYIRPLLFGTLRSLGSAGRASSEATLCVMTCPVDAYFRREGGLRIAIDEKHWRCAPHMGEAKTGGNYASALRPTKQARDKYDVDQLLFAPEGDVQETGAANFVLLRDGHILTRQLDGALLHGITRDSILRLAREDGFHVEERKLSIEEVLTWVRDGEAALTGTAAVVSPVGELVFRGETHPVAGVEESKVANALRAKLRAIQLGRAEDPYGWTQLV